MGQSMYSCDWREQLKINTKKTMIVIGIFISIYVVIGLIIDIGIRQIHADIIIDNHHQPLPNQFFLFIHVLKKIVTLQLVPYATLVMLVIAGVSLLVTYAFHNKIMLSGTRYAEVTHEDTSSEGRMLFNVIEEMKVAAGMRYMPRIFIIDADYMNAFACGYSEKSAMVAVTRGLIAKLNRSQLQAVMAHELSHIRHGDIKLTLTASVLSNLIVMSFDVIFYAVLIGKDSDDRNSKSSTAVFIVIYLIRMLLPMLTALLMLYLSRTREFMADAGCVELQRDNQPLIQALQIINHDHKDHRFEYAKQYRKNPHESVRRESYIYDPIRMGIERKRGPQDWFSTHPSMNKRLEALGYHEAPEVE